jgi:hypothetical protein
LGNNLTFSHKNSLQIVAQQSALTAAATATVGACNTIENSYKVQSPTHHTFIPTGQKTLIQTLTTPTYVIQQHKISPAVPVTALKSISSTLAVEQSLATNLVNNLIVRSTPQNFNSPPLTVISTPDKVAVNTPVSSENTPIH